MDKLNIKKPKKFYLPGDEPSIREYQWEKFQEYISTHNNLTMGNWVICSSSIAEILNDLGEKS